MKSKLIDILCVGELLIDFIGHQSDVMIDNTRDYHRYLGGSPTNVAINCASLGMQSVLVAAVGKDGLGAYALEKLKQRGVFTQNIKEWKDKSTSIILVSKSTETPDFIPYRQADFAIEEAQISKEKLLNTNIFHTTCFALSKGQAQATILKKAKEAYNLGCQLSIDINYSEKVWDSPNDPLDVVKSYCAYNPLVKVSEDDITRLFGGHLSHQDIFDFFHQHGVHIVCLTLGGKGVKLSEKGKEILEMPAKKIDKVVDATGAGDAFWSGFLKAYSQKQSIETAVQLGLQVAAIKLQTLGGIPQNIKELLTLKK